MIDFLRANPWCSQEEYKWGMTVAQIRLSSFDYSRVVYPKNKNKSGAKRVSPKKNLLANMTDFGGPIINK